MGGEGAAARAAGAVSRSRVKPVVSEKSYALLDENKYTFVVDPRAN
ncbi:50S ribosomal protein L23, partial [Streptomyces sp. NPDC047002]